MRITFAKDQVSDIERAILRCGYGMVTNRQGEKSFVRRVARNLFPRFHVYIQEDMVSYTINLHLDQRQPSYDGVTAHSGEYEGPVVETEGARIRAYIAKNSA